MKKLIFLSILTIFISISSSDAGDSKKNAEETEVAASKSSLTRVFLLNRILGQKGIPSDDIGEDILNLIGSQRKIIKTPVRVVGICRYEQGFISLDETGCFHYWDINNWQSKELIRYQLLENERINPSIKLVSAFQGMPVNNILFTTNLGCYFVNFHNGQIIHYKNQKQISYFDYTLKNNCSLYLRMDKKGFGMKISNSQETLIDFNLERVSIAQIWDFKDYLILSIYQGNKQDEIILYYKLDLTSKTIIKNYETEEPLDSHAENALMGDAVNFSSTPKYLIRHNIASVNIFEKLDGKKPKFKKRIPFDEGKARPLVIGDYIIKPGKRKDIYVWTLNPFDSYDISYETDAEVASSRLRKEQAELKKQ